jgi:predicted Zn-dependent protease
VEQYVTALANRVAGHSDWKGQVAVRIVESSAVNCSSFPGGFIYLSSGLLVEAKNDDEIAGVIAHQAAHAATRHWASELTKVTILQFAMTNPLMLFPTSVNAAGASLPVNTFLVCAGYTEYGKPSIPFTMNAPIAFLKEQRKDEMEADYLGLQYVYKAGYDPGAYAALLARLTSNAAPTRSQGDLLQIAPPIADRIAQANREISEILPRASHSRCSPEFVSMKSRLQ